jgi:rubrerythrin
MAKAKTSEKKKVAKKVAVKTTSKKTTVKKTTKKAAGVKKGNKYSCGVCGLAVTVDTACGCVETAHLICCDRPMKAKK